MCRVIVVAFWLSLIRPLAADDGLWETLSGQYIERIAPIVQAHCMECHDSVSQEAMLDLSAFQSLEDVETAYGVWATVLDRVEANEMPPSSNSQVLKDEERAELVDWIRAVRDYQAQRNAGDPGPVLARRLSNAEYNYSVRDLTGVDIRPTRTFPVDPANEAGFDNSGESLSMSPALMNKYLQAARTVVEHLVLTPSGIRFAPHSVVTDTDRDKYCVTRIIEFYKRQPVDYADYFLAAWELSRIAPEDRNASIGLVAGRRQVSKKYLTMLWHTLDTNTFEVGPMGELQTRWQGLSELKQSEKAQAASQEICEFVVETRRRFEPTINNLSIDGVHKGSQPFVLWKNKQYEAYRRKPFLKPADEGIDRGADYVESCERFCLMFPDAMFVSERGRDYLGKPREEQEKGRLLSAGFHSMMGYYRDDAPLYDLVLDASAQRELDTLWRELDFIASAPMRQYQGFLWFDRTDSRFMRDPEFDFARPEDLSSLSEQKIQALSEVYLAKAERNGGTEVPLEAIREFFVEINEQIRWVENARRAAEQRQLHSVAEFAARAYRRSLTSAEVLELRQYYAQLRDEDSLTHEEAVQDLVVSVLMSPHYLYRVDLLSNSVNERAFTNIELASRLSYFLWASIPDAQLLQVAENEQLTDPDVLLRETRRMLQDDRVQGLATEFGGNWLDFRRFKEHNSVDRERFPGFNDELRSAMFEEPIRFLTDVVQNERSTKDFLSSRRTFVNAPLAEHYGIEGIGFDDWQWKAVEDAEEFGRGGLLPMAVFLTKNSPGLRTSPVKRGYWVIRNLLGQRIPAPPPGVPDIPDDETKLGEFTLRETLARHRDHKSCSGCHDRIDPIGLVFEGYGPVGERREVDLGGRAVDKRAQFPDASVREGIVGLRAYLVDQRKEEFVQNLSRKLLAYALGRTLLPSDRQLLAQMEKNSETSDKFNSMIETIVTSEQFLNKRGRDDLRITSTRDVSK